MGRNTVSLYIDDSVVRIMMTRGRRIAKIAELAMETPLSSIDSPEKEADLASKINHLLKFNKIGQKKLVLGISGLRCLTRPVILPELPKAMLAEAVIREARRMLPVPVEQLYLSWQVVSVSGGKTQVFMTALPRQLADTVIRIIHKAGCKPYLMDIKPLALARLSKEADAVILDVQNREFDIVVMIDGIPQPIRTIAFPQEALSLANKFDIIKADLARTLEFVKSKTDEKQLKPDAVLYVSGELAEHPELFDTLSAEIGLKVDKLISPLKYIKYLEPSQYLANVGLSLKEHSGYKSSMLPNFNSLPEPYLPMRISMNKLMAVPAAACAVGVLVLLGLTVQNAAVNIQKAQSQIQTNNFMLEKKQAQKKQLLENVSTLENNIALAEAEYNLYTAALKELSETGNNFNTDLSISLDNLDDSISFASLALNADSISITGSADDEEDVFRYVRKLTATGRFRSITINNITSTLDEETGETSVSYSLSCVLEGNKK